MGKKKSDSILQDFLDKPKEILVETPENIQEALDTNEGGYKDRYTLESGDLPSDKVPDLLSLIEPQLTYQDKEKIVDALKIPESPSLRDIMPPVEIKDTDELKDMVNLDEVKLTSPEIIEEVTSSFLEGLIIKPEISSVKQSATHYAKRNIEVLNQSTTVDYNLMGDIFKARPDKPVKN